MILVALLIIILAVLLFIASKCLKLITNPVHYNEEHTRQYEIEKGFPHAVEAYDNEWSREDFTIDRNGANIHGEIIRNPDSPKDRTKVAIVCHGHTANRFSALKYADMFYRAGFNLIIYDARSFGVSGGGYCTLGQEEALDLSEIFALARKTFSDDCLIALHGESMGAATSLLVLKYEDPDLVIADCPFADSRRLFKEWISSNMSLPWFFVLPFIELLAMLKYSYNIRKTSPIEAVRQSEVPICFMHGDSDKLIDCNHSKKMYEVCRNPLSEIHLFKGADHAQSVILYPKEYEEIFRAFLKKNSAL